MGNQDLWALMQRVERLRYRAELLERASIGQPPVLHDLLLELADQARLMAEHEGAPCPRCVEAECCSACAYRSWALATPLS
jgi:hypothetical protein